MDRRVTKNLKLNIKKIILFIVCALVTFVFIAKLIDFGKNPMKKPIVFLIPENFIGPVFVVFDQKDGQELKTDPLGLSLNVPQNGLVKVKASKDDVLTKGMNYDKRNVYWITHKDGDRINIPYLGGGGRDYEKEVDWSWYIDTHSTVKKIIYDRKIYPQNNDTQSYFFTKTQAKTKTIYEWNMCRAEIWRSDEELETYMANYQNEDRQKGERLSCMSFSVLYPNMNNKHLDASEIYQIQSLQELEQFLISLSQLKQQYLNIYSEK